MVDIIETTFDVGVYNPFFLPIRADPTENFFYGIVGASAWTEAVTASLELSRPTWF